MFMYIANLWFRHENIDDGSITSDIGGQFAEWEIPGTINLSRPNDKEQWARLKSWIDQADKKYNDKNKKT